MKLIVQFTFANFASSQVIVPTVFGPFVENYPAHKNRVNLGTDDFVYALIKDTPANGDFAANTPPFGAMADVRDIAKAVRLLSFSFSKLLAHGTSGTSMFFP